MNFADRPLATIAARIGYLAKSWLRAICPVALLLVLPIGSALGAQLTLTWQDNSDDELGFKIERSDNGAPFVQIATIAPNVTTYVDTTVVSGLPYSYRVAAFNAIGSSPYSNVVTNAPAIATQPASQTVPAFQIVTFTVAAVGVPTPGYQWQKGGINLVDGIGASGVIVSGSTTATLTLTSVRVADAGNYAVVVSNGIVPNVTSNNAILTVNQAIQTVTISFNAIVNYSPGALYDPGATSSSGLPISYTSSNPAVATASGSTVTITGAGVTSITASQAGDANFLPATSGNSQNLAVNRALQTITFPAFQPAAIGSPPITLNATSSSGLPISYLSLDTSIATISGNILTILATSTTAVNIAASQSGDSNYFAADTVQQRLNIAPPIVPSITTQPTGQTIVTGGTTTFTASAGGFPAPTVQWQVSTDGGSTWTNLTNTSPYSGVTTATLTITGVAFGQSGYQYRSVATNFAGTATSSAATLTVTGTVPAITSQPSSQTAGIGATVIFSVAASGTPTPTLQWQISTDGGSTWTNLTNTAPYSGVTTTTLTISGVVLGQTGSQYRCVATNLVGVGTSNAATLTINANAPVFTTQPVGKNALPGSTVSFTVAASGTPAPTFIWQKNGVNLSDGGTVSGSATSTLTLTGISITDAATYTAVATNVVASVSSNSVILGTVSVAASSQSVTSGSSVTLTAAIGSAPVTSIQWYQNGTFIPGATNATLTISGATQAANAGTYAALITNGAGTLVSGNIALNVVRPGRLVNISVRAVAGQGAQTLIAGLSIAGGTKSTLIRGIGPALVPFGVAGALTDPQLNLFSGAGALLLSNDNWGGTTALSNAFTAVGAFPLASNSLDAALLTPAPAGQYTAQISGPGSGVALAEVYDNDNSENPAGHFNNISSRAQVGTGNDVVIAGFVVYGDTPVTVLIRGIGPALTAYGVTGVLADPQIDLFQGSTVLQHNDNWGGTSTLIAAFAQVGAFSLPDPNSKDAALIATLQPGAYTVVLSGVNATTGVGLMELYQLP